jgi:hypothetical protein
MASIINEWGKILSIDSHLFDSEVESNDSDSEIEFSESEMIRSEDEVKKLLNYKSVISRRGPSRPRPYQIPASEEKPFICKFCHKQVKTLCGLTNHE